MRRVVAVLAVVAALGTVGLLAGCGGGSGSTATSSGPSAANGLRGAATDYYQLTLDGKYVDTYRYLSAACRDQWSAEAWAANVTVGMALAKALGTDLSGLKLGEVQTRNVTDTSGQVLALLVDSNGSPAAASTSNPNWEDWVVENGTWLISTCKNYGGTSTTASK